MGYSHGIVDGPLHGDEDVDEVPARRVHGVGFGRMSDVEIKIQVLVG